MLPKALEFLTEPADTASDRLTKVETISMEEPRRRAALPGRLVVVPPSAIVGVKRASK